MKIAFDVSSLAHSQTGIPRVNYNILQNLNFNKKDIYIFSFSKLKIKTLKKFGSFTYFMPFKMRYVRFIWFNFILPFILYIKGIDYLVCHQRLPILTLNIRFILFYHDFTWKVEPSTMNYSNYILDRFRCQSSLKKADIIITPSESIKKEILKFYPKVKSKVNVIYWGSNFNKNKKYKRKKNFLFVGKFEPRKNIHLLLKAYSLLNEQEKIKHNLYLVGSKGWGNVDINKYINDFGIKKFVRVYEKINDKKLEILYSTSLYTILISKYEGYGLPIIESISCGTPTIVSDIFTLKEINKNCGLIVNHKNIDDIVIKLKLACHNNSIYSKFLKNIKNRNLPSWQKAGKDINKLIKINYKT